MAMNKNRNTICGKKRITLPDAANHAVAKQALQGPGRHAAIRHHGADELLARLDPAHERAGASV